MNDSTKSGNTQKRPARRRRSRRRGNPGLPNNPTANPPGIDPGAENPHTPLNERGGRQATSSLSWTPDVELIADLRDVPTQKVIDRIRHVLAQVSSDVTLIIWVHDRPDMTPLIPVLYQELRGKGYYSDTTRLPQGGQRVRISRQRWRKPSSVTNHYSEEATDVIAPTPKQETPSTSS